MSDQVEQAAGDLSAIEQERAYLAELAGKPFGARLRGYLALSGPGWLQSALTLGGGSLAGGLYLGVIAGFSMLWLQPLAMILGIIMLSAIGYVTLSTGERPFRAINRHVNPVLGWSWLIASMMANMVWALPQYSLATGVLQQNLFPDFLGANGPLTDMQSKLLISFVILGLSIAITWSYGSGHWGVRLYEKMLKVIVAIVVLSFIGVVVRIAVSEQGLNWSAVLGGFVPDFGALFRPAAGFTPLLADIPAESRDYWTRLIVDKQRDVLMASFATAVGINMTFLLPYSMLGRKWGREHRELAVFDLSTGMFIPFFLATSCVVIAAANQFYTVPQQGLISTESGGGATAKQRTEFDQMLEGRLRDTIRRTSGDETASWTPERWKSALDEQKTGMHPAEERLAATLVTRDANALAQSLVPLFEGKAFFANIVFGIGVLGMALSTITLLMLVSGFVVCEVLEVPPSGWPHRLGCLFAATGALGPFIWSKAAFLLAVPTSVFGLMLMPIGYLTFLLLMNQKSLLGAEMLTGGKRIVANSLMGLATGVAFFASGWAVWANTGVYGAAAMIAFLVLVAVVQVVRKPAPPRVLD